MSHLDPTSIFNSGIDRNRTFIEITREKPVAAGQSITKEGAILIAVASGGEEAVQMSAGAATDVPIGISLTDDTLMPVRANVEDVVVPSSGTLTAALRFANIVAASYVLIDLDNGNAVLTEGGGDDYTLDATSGVITFVNNALKGHDIRVFYSFNVTVAQLQTTFGGQRSINNQGGALFGSVSVGLGYCEVFTLVYDSAQVYAVNDQLKTGSGGRFTKGGLGVNFGKVIKAPLVGDPFLGVRFNTTL